MRRYYFNAETGQWFIEDVAPASELPKMYSTADDSLKGFERVKTKDMNPYVRAILARTPAGFTGTEETPAEASSEPEAPATCIRCANILMGFEARGEICNGCLGKGYGYGHDDTKADPELVVGSLAHDNAWTQAETPEAGEPEECPECGSDRGTDSYGECRECGNPYGEPYEPVCPGCHQVPGPSDLCGCNCSRCQALLGLDGSCYQCDNSRCRTCGHLPTEQGDCRCSFDDSPGYEDPRLAGDYLGNYYAQEYDDCPY